MANDKKISELPIAETINASDRSILISNNADYQFDFSTLLQFINSGLNAGANLTFGQVLPQNTSGKNGDVFINTAAGSFAQKIAGTWTVVYTIAAGGSTDTTILYGTTTPTTATGNNGDTFINTISGIFYKKTGGAWGQVFSMQTGPQGLQGASGTNGTNGTNGKTILNGTTNPANSLGTDGDFYINTASYYLFGPKNAGVWGTGISLIVSGVQFEETDNKNTPNGYAGLDSSGKIASAQLPSYVDDVLEVANYASLPITGETGKIYITTDTNNEYRWSGSAYIQIVASPGTTDAVPEGTTNKYFTLSRVLNTILTGIGFGSAAAVSATDTVLQALGKLQAQITGLFKIPAGGASGQILAKMDGTDGNVGWITPTSANGINPQYPKLPVNMARLVTSFGTSITAGYLLPSPRYAYPFSFATKCGLNLDGTNYAQSATNSFSALRQAYAYLPQTKNRNTIILAELGYNDFQGGDLSKEYNRLQGITRAFIANALLEMAKPGNAPGAFCTGTWLDFDSSSHGGKAAHLGGSAKVSTTPGSTITLSDLTNSYGTACDTIVIGTYANIGDNSTGGFQVVVNGEVVYTYNPNGRTSGITDISGYDNSITPDIVLLKGVNGSDIKIVTTSNYPTIIDYWGGLLASNNTASVFVATIPESSDAVYNGNGSTRSKTIIHQATTIIKAVVDEFQGFPVTLVDINKYYDPNTQSDDGIHPNKEGHFSIARAFFDMIAVGVNGWPVPHVPVVGGERFITVTDSGAQATYDVADYVVPATGLTESSFTNGTANVAGKTGQISSDLDFLYVCVGTNTWVRVALIQEKIDLFLASIDDSNGAKTSIDLNIAYPTAVIYQIVKGILYNYQKVSSTVWEKTAKSIA